MKNIYLNSNVHKIISNDINSNMLNHGYLLISNDKFKINQFAEFVCCTILGGDKFDENVCKKILHGNHPDVKQYPQNGKNIVTEEVNKITDDSFVLPMEGEKKIYVLKNFESATIQAQNKLLKTLEEPSKSVVFVLTTTNENGVLSTIKSRCKKITEGKVSDGLIADFLRANYKLPEVDEKKIISLCEGNLSIINEFLNNKTYLEMVSLCEEIFTKLKSSSDVLELSSKMQKHKANLEDLLNIMLKTLNQSFVGSCNKDNFSYVSKVSLGISKVILSGIKKVKSNCSASSVCDGVLMGILEVKFKCQK